MCPAATLGIHDYARTNVVVQLSPTVKVMKAIHATLQDGSHRIWKKKSLLTTDKIWLVRMYARTNGTEFSL